MDAPSAAGADLVFAQYAEAVAATRAERASPTGRAAAPHPRRKSAADAARDAAAAKADAELAGIGFGGLRARGPRGAAGGDPGRRFLRLLRQASAADVVLRR